MRETVFLLINSLECGGAERVFSNLSRALETEYNLYLILLYRQTDEDYPAGGQIIVLDDGKKRSRLGQMLFFKKELEKYAKRYRPQCIVSSLLNACLCNMLANTHTKKIISIRNFLKKQFKGVKRPIWEFFFKRIFVRADITVSVSEQMKRDLIQSYGFKPEKSMVIYNPYNIREIEAAAAQPIEDEYASLFSHRVIITLGNLGRQKGHCHLIRAFAEVKKTVGDIRLVMIGKDSNVEFAERLRQLAADLRIADDAVFLGYRSNPHRYLSRAAIFVFPSLYEGFPNALVEAMVCGLPVISADCKTGPREILAPGTDGTVVDTIEECEYGMLVPAAKTDWLDAKEPLTEDEILLSKAMETLLADTAKRERYAQKSRERGNMFAMGRIIGGWKEIL
jgi:glycosyltransferase involved in cell wall biosynthesis